MPSATDPMQHGAGPEAGLGQVVDLGEQERRDGHRSGDQSLAGSAAAGGCAAAAGVQRVSRFPSFQ
jgi:hypothetical protein